jgi:MoaA/NifB/PqqE/SkfB family radical SAM enzyme
MNELARAFTPDVGKFLRHPKQLTSARKRTGHTVISTHISPTAACDLSCSYCAYSERDQSQQIDLAVMQDYVEKLMSRGLTSVLLSGGGEPTLHPDFNEFVDWMADRRLKIGLITNGVNSERVDCWSRFEWVRVSINIFPNWQERINVPHDQMRDGAALGCSFVYVNQTVGELAAAANLAEDLGAEYMRLAVNFLGDAQTRARQSAILEDKISDLRGVSIARSDLRAPQCDRCRIAYFRPMLAETSGGTVYSCWQRSLPGSGCAGICKPWDILEFLDGKMPPDIIPSHDCLQCPCVDAVEALDAWMCNNATAHDLFV